MVAKWVDNEVYFGPDRRRRDGGRRLFERRRHNDAAEPPSLAAVLRRLRVRISGTPSPVDRAHALQLVNMALTEAERRRLFGSAEHLRAAAELIHAGRYVEADAEIVRAMAIAAGAA